MRSTPMPTPDRLKGNLHAGLGDDNLTVDAGLYRPAATAIRVEDSRPTASGCGEAGIAGAW